MTAFIVVADDTYFKESIPPLYTSQRLNIAEAKQELDHLVTQGFSYKKAGQLYADSFVTKFLGKEGFSSITHLIDRINCLEHAQWDKHDSVLDDFFVKITPQDSIDRTAKPIFNEVYYAPDAPIIPLDLASVETRFKIISDVNSGILPTIMVERPFQFSTIIGTSKHLRSLLKEFNWLKEQLTSQNLVHTVTILEDDGTLRMYTVTGG